MKISLNLKSLFLLTLLCGTLGIFGSIILARNIIESASETHTFSDIALLPEAEVALVLGCSRYLSDGRQNLFFHNRIEAAIEVFNKGKAQTILVSGDNHVVHYNEPQDMKDSLIELGIPEERIVCDYAGFSTLDSIVRAKEVFGQETLIVISQEFHNRRAIFIGKQRGLDLVGYNAREVNAFHSIKTKLREELARVKTVLDIWVLNRQPKFLGDAILIPAIKENSHLIS